MSNIQITENRLGKYSPEWFYNESQTSEWTAFMHIPQKQSTRSA